MCLKGLVVMHIASLPIPPILHNKTASIIKPKLESVSLSCKSHRCKTANIKMLFSNSKHRILLPRDHAARCQLKLGMGGTDGTTVYRGTKFHGTGTAEGTVLSRYYLSK